MIRTTIFGFSLKIIQVRLGHPSICSICLVSSFGLSNLTRQYYVVPTITASALASALREREDTLQHCATLLANNQLDELATILKSYEQRNIIQRRHRNKEKTLDFTQGGFDNHDIELLRKGLNRMPRRVSTAHSKRAGVVLPLCNVDGVPCILFEKRSSHLRAHPDEVSFLFINEARCFFIVCLILSHSC